MFVIEDPFHEQPTAAWEALKADVDYLVRHRHPWRVAVVTDQPLVIGAMRLTSWLVPGAVRAFGLSELREAREWILSTSPTGSCAPDTEQAVPYTAEYRFYAPGA